MHIMPPRLAEYGTVPVARKDPEGGGVDIGGRLLEARPPEWMQSAWFVSDSHKAS